LIQLPPVLQPIVTVDSSNFLVEADQSLCVETNLPSKQTPLSNSTACTAVRTACFNDLDVSEPIVLKQERESLDSFEVRSSSAEPQLYSSSSAQALKAKQLFFPDFSRLCSSQAFDRLPSLVSSLLTFLIL